MTAAYTTAKAAYDAAAATAATSLATATTAQTAADAAEAAVNSLATAQAYQTAAAAAQAAAATAVSDATAAVTAATAVTTAAAATASTADNTIAATVSTAAATGRTQALALQTASATDVANAAAAITSYTPRNFTLTTGIDNFTGGSGNDTFVADDTPTAKVTSAADKLDGGAGTGDTLTIYGTPNAIPQIANIELITVNSMGDGGSASFTTSTGVTRVTNDRAVGAATIAVADGVAVTVSRNADATKDQTVTFGSTDTSANLTLDTFKTNTTKKLIINGTKVATVNVATTEAASTIGLLDNGGATTLTKVVVTGNKDLTVTDAIPLAVATIDASALTGKLSVKSTTNGATQDAADAAGVDKVDLSIVGGSGNDTIDVSPNAADNEVVAIGGAGDDKIKIKTAVAYAAATATNAGDNIDGGDGTDTLSVDGDLDASDLSKAIKNFEILEFTATANSTDMSVNKLAMTSFLSTGDNVDVTLTGLANNVTFTIDGDGSDLAATIGTDGTADVLNVVLQSTGTVTGSALTATNYETVNINSTKLSTEAATVANSIATLTASAATKVVLTGATNLTGGTLTAKAGSTIDARAYTGDLTAATLGATTKSYLGGTGKDEITLAAGDLKQGNSFAGGAGKDKLTVTASSGQNAGVLAVTGFETIVLSTDAAAGDTVTADFRNVTDLTTLSVSAGDPTDNLTLSRLGADTTLTFATSFGNVATTVQSGTSQKVAASAAATVASFDVDAGTTTLTVTSDNGNTTADQAILVFTSLTGSSLTSIVLNGLDRTNLGTLGTTMTSVDASASKGRLTMTASATATSVIGSQAADSITGGNGNDTIQGGKGADTLSGGAGTDTYVFEAKAADNGIDDIVAVAGAAGDRFQFKNFLPSGSVLQNGGAGTAIVAVQTSGSSDLDITNKLALYSDPSLNGTQTAANVVVLIQGAGNQFALSAGGKAILFTGDDTGANDVYQIWYIDDSLDGVSGTVSATDVVSVGIANAALELDNFTTANFLFA